MNPLLLITTVAAFSHPSSGAEVRWTPPAPIVRRVSVPQASRVLHPIVASPPATSSTIPRPPPAGPDAFRDYVALPRTLTVTQETFALICPAWPGYDAATGCDPYSMELYEPGAQLAAGGYVIREGLKFWWIDAGINQYGGHEYGWVRDTTVR